MKEHIYAFPIELPGTEQELCGMTLRDYFAAKALEGDWASQGDIGTIYNHTKQEILVERAKIFWRMADAMLEARDL